MVLSTTPVWEAAAESLVVEYENAVVYGDYGQDEVLHEGPVRVLANGWVALPTNRVLSPDAVHHVDELE